ncbi:MAG TPA: COX15/CtaA family protein [Burkholderiaceae bacterium]|nr:COX15/CtaA family protein [Burkholderiaceae bacterium]
MNTPAVDMAPALELLAIATLLAGAVLALWWWRQRRVAPLSRHVKLAVLTAFITADLIVFGAFTRLTDSGLGCPDWPGCYGQASPLGASTAIDSAERAMPTGPVTVTKAWIEMIHRYLAMAVGAMLLALNIVLWRARRALERLPLWAAAALLWVVVQGLFGKYTVTLRLYPAVVTAHLFGGMVLLALLVAQIQSLRRPPPLAAARAAALVLALVALQIVLGGWVSSNYAVLACRGFPQCNGQWWPPADYAQGFTLLRELGRAGGDSYVEFRALVAIQMVHRLFALLVTVAVLALSIRLWRGAARRAALGLLSLLAMQMASGLSNVLLDWPLIAALLHTATAAALIALLTALAARGSGVARAQTALPTPTGVVQRGA